MSSYSHFLSGNFISFLTVPSPPHPSRPKYQIPTHPSHFSISKRRLNPTFTTPARFPAFPGFYEFFFVFYEPLAAFSPVFFYFIWPGKYGLYDMPRIEEDLAPTTYLDSRGEMALYQMVNCHLLIVTFVSFVFYAARKNLRGNPRVQESVVGAVLSALAIADITHLLGMHFAVIPEASRYQPETWGSTIWVSDAIVSLDFIVRLAWFAGVGRTRYYYGQPEATETKGVKAE